MPCPSLDQAATVASAQARRARGGCGAWLGGSGEAGSWRCCRWQRGRRETS